MTSGTLPAAPFGRVLTAMVTPFHDDGSRRPRGHRPGRGAPRRPRPRRRRGLRYDGGVADHERPRRTASCCGPSSRRSGTGPRSSPASAPTTPRTRSSWPAQAEKLGADGVLLVTPYYNKPHAGRASLAHFRAVADASGLPVMLYDIPGRTGITDRTETLPPARRARPDRGGEGRGRRPVPRASQIMARHRPGVLLRRRRAQPRLAGPRRRRRRLAWSATSPGDRYAAMVEAVDAGDLRRRARDLPRPAARRSRRS